MEKKTVQVMVELFCHGNHGTKRELCEDCSKLLQYSLERIDSCPFGANKPVCSKCPIHCYKKDMREQVQTVMRYSGPRMIFYHPILAIRHLLRKQETD